MVKRTPQVEPSNQSHAEADPISIVCCRPPYLLIYQHWRKRLQDEVCTHLDLYRNLLEWYVFLKNISQESIYFFQPYNPISIVRYLK